MQTATATSTGTPEAAGRKTTTEAGTTLATAGRLSRCRRSSRPGSRETSAPPALPGAPAIGATDSAGTVPGAEKQAGLAAVSVPALMEGAAGAGVTAAAAAPAEAGTAAAAALAASVAAEEAGAAAGSAAEADAVREEYEPWQWAQGRRSTWRGRRTQYCCVWPVSGGSSAGCLQLRA